MTSPKPSVLLPHTWGEVRTLVGVTDNKAPDPASALQNVSAQFLDQETSQGETTLENDII